MLYVKRLTETAHLPKMATDGSAGYDLYADEDVTIPPHNSTTTVKTGIAVGIDPGKCGQIWPRSGMASKKEVTRDAGLIDSDYTGEVCVVMVNRSAFAYPVRRGDRIAQLMLTSAFRDTVVEVDSLNETDRGANGFGSTGS